MLTLKGKYCKLRALEPEDLEYLYRLENDTKIWELSGTFAPYSKAILERYLDQAHLDIYEAKQFRFCICDDHNKRLGLIDLFEFDPINKRVGVGVLVYNEEDRGKGIGTEALQLVCDYAFKVLDVHQVFANILEDNSVSRTVFEKLGFSLIGTKKDWVRIDGTFKNEVLYQKINA
ncbi:GNAT family N-acetyltransferase [Croceivirga sp. JEA036]|uniref:GNAT family N-acetyltransferase n=1 Tax=Croceivirga sp. JEA036 TaxID=2721162 RepID=UPI00143C2301|nr:GNAT family N-acetyltransferase [Croceivirga sp. JEA036]NJB35891.1 GNAT family N-acetyltransferase [Croceivirga sp. JEA036]